MVCLFSVLIYYWKNYYLFTKGLFDFIYAISTRLYCICQKVGTVIFIQYIRIVGDIGRHSEVSDWSFDEFVASCLGLS